MAIYVKIRWSSPMPISGSVRWPCRRGIWRGRRCSWWRPSPARQRRRSGIMRGGFGPSCVPAGFTTNRANSPMMSACPARAASVAGSWWSSRPSIPPSPGRRRSTAMATRSRPWRLLEHWRGGKAHGGEGHDAQYTRGHDQVPMSALLPAADLVIGGSQEPEIPCSSNALYPVRGKVLYRRVLSLFLDVLGCLRCGHGFGEIEALQLDAACRLHMEELSLGFYALGGGYDAKPVSEVDDQLDDLGAFPIFGDVIDEGFVDLDLVERETEQIAERGISGAEIIHCDPHAKIAQIMECCQILVIVLEDDGLGDLELQPRCGKIAGGKDFRDFRDELAIPELVRRHIDRDVDLCWPVGSFGAGLPEYPFPDISDQPCFLGDGDEPGWRDHSARRMAPAGKCLEPSDRPASAVDGGLIEDFELAIRERLPQIGLQHLAILKLLVHFRLEETEAATA